MIRVYFADGAHEDRAEGSPINRAEDGTDPKKARLIEECRPDSGSRSPVWAVQDGRVRAAKIESVMEQIQRERAEEALAALAVARASALAEAVAWLRDRANATDAEVDDDCDGEDADRFCADASVLRKAADDMEKWSK